MDLVIETHHTAIRTILTLRGELDLASYRAFKEVIDDLVVDGHVDLVLDLDEVSFVDSLGLGALVGTRRRTAVHHGSLELVCSNPAVLQVFRLTHLDRVFTILDRLPADCIPATTAD
jgi:anti-sigma B factor antagonist